MTNEKSPTKTWTQPTLDAIDEGTESIAGGTGAGLDGMGGETGDS